MLIVSVMGNSYIDQKRSCKLICLGKIIAAEISLFTKRVMWADVFIIITIVINLRAEIIFDMMDIRDTGTGCNAINH